MAAIVIYNRYNRDQKPHAEVKQMLEGKESFRETLT